MSTSPQNRRHIDDRTRYDRVENQIFHWNMQYEKLVQGYLVYMMERPCHGDFETENEGVSTSGDPFTIEVIDTHSKFQRSCMPMYTINLFPD